jgi:hypothetical protein
MIERLQDLCEEIGASKPSELNRRIYKDTDCGAWISVHVHGWKKFGPGDDWKALDELYVTEPGVAAIDKFTIGSIVEGSNAEFSREFDVPCESAEINSWLEELEGLTDEAHDQA